MFTSLIGGLIALLSVLTAAPAATAAQAVKMGLIDLAVDKADFADLKNVTVRTLSFWTSGTAEARRQDKAHARSHGAEMVRAAAKGFQAVDAQTPIIVYVATPFRADAKTGALMLDMDDLNFAYDWFAHEGVLVVAETFVGPDSELQHDALRRAVKKGLVVLASAGNGPAHNAVPPFPAAYDEAISISTTALAADLAREPNRDAYVDFSVAPKAFSAIAYRQDPELSSLQGSSAASATAAGLLTALSLRAAVRDRADALLLLGCVARPAASFAGGRAWGDGVLVAHEIGAKLRAQGPGAHPCNDAT
jgi:hypothetical protein